MVTYYPVWDISWLAAFVGVISSVIWIFNALVVWQPWRSEPTTFAVLWGGGLSAFVGATVSEIGAVFLMLEAFNSNRYGCFGWALEQLITSDGQQLIRVSASRRLCNHHHVNKKSLLRGPNKVQGKEETVPDAMHAIQAWTWWPSEVTIRDNLVHELGFWASSIQMIGATIFYVSGITALPGIFNRLSPVAVIGTCWVPQIVGGSLLIASSLLVLIETQKKWWMPAPRILGWHIGFWSIIGSLGFTLSGIFGLFPARWAVVQSSCTTL